jgi:hypothetical protein
MSFECSREIRKLDVRFGDYVKAEQEFSEHMKDCIRVLKELMETLENRDGAPSYKETRKLSELRREAIESLSEVLASESDVEHEKSHVFKSYAALILCLNKEFEKLKP